MNKDKEKELRACMALLLDTQEYDAKNTCADAEMIMDRALSQIKAIKGIRKMWGLERA